ncbi:Abi family protein [Limosilactobacillus fermentum]|uniref:CAAX protease n=1 Tax=Limosilactobacillus fermentum NB-22 TaxID=1408443 RepID=A0A829LWU0_LIMFE|nr:Abi family protein [Limosilactobacillus fermentum]ESS02030.1 CAAX protease [Limosilactobacillus fermentum NB-22]MCH5394993.1 Abi family protein [Limosilactobacillus fermentum]QZY77022.1 Abi family protein [Limosilactobacillus fermentum]
MKDNLKHLNPEEQRSLLEHRGIKFPEDRHEIDANKIQEIGYYKLKEFAYSFAKRKQNGKLALSDDKEIIYEQLTFKKLLVRYYMDKNLRIFILHAIEDIEVYLNNIVATQLGLKYGAFGYLEYKNWCDRSIPKFEIEKKQFYFKKDLLTKIKRSNLPDIKLEWNQNTDGFPSVWVMTDCLTFGDTINLVKIMSLNNKKVLASKFNCTPTELISWLSCMNFIRNACVHNSDLIDIKIRTKPTPPARYTNCLYSVKGGYSNKIAAAVLITKFMMESVNSRYKFGNIYDSLYKLIDGDEELAHSLGFSEIDSIKCLTKRSF